MGRKPHRHVLGVSPLGFDHLKHKPPASGGIQIEGSIRVDRSPELCYRYWRDFSKLSSFMEHVESVEVIDDRRSHWVVEAPADTTVEWDAEIIEDIPGERISWRSLEEAQIDNAGSVHFASRQDGHQTDVQVLLTYNPPLGVIGEVFSKLFRENPEDQLDEDLGRFKAIVEQSSPPDIPTETHL